MNDTARATPSARGSVRSTIAACLVLLSIALSGCTKQAASQCSAEAVQTTDSTLYLEGGTFEGVLFTENRSLGSVKDAEGEEREVDILSFVGAPDSAKAWTPSLQEICQFEADFEEWWRNSEDSGQSVRNEVAEAFRKVDHLLRQYVGYQVNEGRKMRVAFFHPEAAEPISRWKAEPFVLTDGWPVYFVVTYDMSSNEITMEPPIGN